MRKKANGGLHRQPWRGRRRPLKTASKVAPIGRQDGARPGWRYYRPSLLALTAGGLLWAGGALLGRFNNDAGRLLARGLSNFVAFFSRLIPLPLSELCLFGAVLLILWLLVGGAVKGRGRGFLRGLCRVGALAIWTGALFTLLWGVHYQAPSLAQQLGLEVRPRSPEELTQTAQILLAQANELADQVPRDDQGAFLPDDFDSITEQINRQYEALGLQYPLYQTSLPRRAKRSILLRPLMPWVGIAGYYFPFTAEPTVGQTAPTHLAYNVAHELAHSLGVAPEDEAGFSAYLACIEAEDPGLRYSAALNGYIYASNALYRLSPELSSAVSSQANENLRRDIRALNEYLRQFEGPAQQAGNKINDVYLKSNNQPAGVRSYGDMVDLLIAYTLK